MTELLLDCPNCGGSQVGFSPRFRWAVDPLLSQTVALCNHCNKGALLTHANPETQTKIRESTWWPHRDVKSSLVQIDPAPRSTEGPDHLPQNVAAVYRQALDNLHRRNWDGAGMLCRRALDVGIKNKQLDPKGDLAKLTLAKRIDELEARRMITPDLKDWAHHLRRLGNDAAHEDDPFDEASAKEMIEFADLFFRYVFTLPEMMRRSRTLQQPAAANP